MPIPLGAVSIGGGATPGTIVQQRFAFLGDVLLGGVDDFGTVVYLNDLAGWEGSTGTTLQTENRSAADGAWVSPANLPGRVIEVTLTLQGRSFSDVAKSLRRISGQVPLNAPVDLVVNDHGDELMAGVIQGGEVLSTQKASHARASLSLFAEDPRRYSVDLVTASTGLPLTTGGLRLPFRLPQRVAGVVQLGIITATNDGNLDTPPVFTVVGPCPPFMLTHRGTSKTLRYHEAVPAGRTVVIDTATQTVLLDGVAPRYVTGSWFTYAPGRNEVAFTADTYDADASVVSQHRNAWK